MGIKQLTPMQSVMNHLDEQIERKKQALIRSLAYVGESCLREMRGNYDYEDQTGNLTSSKGYAIIVDGKIVHGGQLEVKKSGAEGVKDGEAFIKQLINQFPQGVALILAVGMDYASYVSDKGYNVMDSAESMADRLVPQMLNKLGFKKR